MKLQPGKLPHSLLADMIGKYRGAGDANVLLGPSIGEDAAVIELKDICLVLKTDPITYAAEDIGWYAVHINANDIATMGARPRWFQANILLPQGTTEAGVERIFQQIDNACRELGIAVTGGHTEITPGIDRPIIVGDMHGVCEKNELIFSSGAKIGDSIILTKGAGIEGTATLARELKERLKDELPKALLKRAEGYLYEPGISIVPEATLGAKSDASAMHDPTEGGVMTGLYELAAASGKGILVDREKMIIRDETRRICEHLDINPLGLLGSGALLVTLSKDRTDDYLDELKGERIEASVIGEMTRESDGLKIVEDGRRHSLRYSERDEILKVL